MSKKELIIEEIRKIYDPELPVNIYELGLIYDIIVENEKSAKIKMTLTTPNSVSYTHLTLPTTPYV